MGHADIRTTMNIYAKAVSGWEQGAASKLDAYLDATGGTVPDPYFNGPVMGQSTPQTGRS